MFYLYYIKLNIVTQYIIEFENKTKASDLSILYTIAIQVISAGIIYFNVSRQIRATMKRDNINFQIARVSKLKKLVTDYCTLILSARDETFEKGARHSREFYLLHISICSFLMESNLEKELRVEIDKYKDGVPNRVNWVDDILSKMERIKNSNNYSHDK